MWNQARPFFMSHTNKTGEEIRHLLRYYQQAVHEFFDDAAHEILERLGVIEKCFEKNENSKAEFQKMIEYVSSNQKEFEKKVKDLGFLVERMEQLMKEFE